MRISAKMIGLKAVLKKLNKISHKSGEPIVEMGYGTKYALPVHERTDIVNFTTPGTSNKYLQKPIEEAQGGYASRIAKRTSRLMSKGYVSNSIPDSLGQALYQEGQQIMAKSVIICPKEFSNLVKNRYVAPPKYLRAEGDHPTRPKDKGSNG